MTLPNRRHVLRYGAALGAVAAFPPRATAEEKAVRNGRVLATGYDPVLYGNYLLIHGEGENRSYFYAHMPKPARAHKGQRVWEGERVGEVGETGNAITVGCHLHFEIHVHGVPVDPEPSLRRWDRYS